MRLSWILHIALLLSVFVAYGHAEEAEEKEVDETSDADPDFDDGEMLEPGEGEEVDPASVEGEEPLEDGSEGIGPDDGEPPEEEPPLSEEQLTALHKKIDANGDGKLSLEELKSFSKVTKTEINKKDAEYLWEDMDGNKDGKVSLEEYLNGTFSQPPLQEVEGEEGKEELTTRNQKLDPEEEKVEKELETEKFKQADLNGDGFLDKTELPIAINPDLHEPTFHQTATEFVAKRDKNKDGELDSEEFWSDQGEGDRADDEENKAVAQADFEKLDLDKNGKLSVDEIKPWESGDHFTAEAMNDLVNTFDQDNDTHVSLKELVESGDLLPTLSAASHFNEWAEHHEL